MTEEIDRGPARTSGAIALGAALVAAVTFGALAPPALAPGVAGVALVAWGLRSESRKALWLAGGALFLALVVAGIEGASTGLLLVGAGLTVVAWDAAGNALEMGAQLGRGASTERAELAHVVGTAGVTFGTVAVGYALYVAAAGGRPVVSLVLLSFATLVLASALRNTRPGTGG